MPFIYCEACGRLARQSSASVGGLSCPQCGQTPARALDLADEPGTGFFLHRVWHGARLNERPLKLRDLRMLLHDFSTAETRHQDALDMTDAYRELKQRHPDLDIQDWINDMLEAFNRAFEHDMLRGVPAEAPAVEPTPDDGGASAVPVPAAELDAARPWTRALAAVRTTRGGDPFLHFLVENWFNYAYSRYLGKPQAAEPADARQEPEPAGEPVRERPGAGCLFNSLSTLAVLALAAGLLLSLLPG